MNKMRRTEEIRNRQIIFLITHAKGLFQQIAQWRENGGNISFAANVFEYTAKAVILVELAEILDCDCIGGRSIREPDLNGIKKKLSLYGRWLWLRNKYYTTLSLESNGWKLNRYFNESNN